MPGPDDPRAGLKAWAALGTGQQLHALALRAYDQMIGLELRDVAVGGCIPRRQRQEARRTVPAGRRKAA